MTSKDIYERQCEFDKAHHLLRVQHFELIGKSNLDHFDKKLLRESKAYNKHTHYNSCGCSPRCSINNPNQVT